MQCMAGTAIETVEVETAPALLRFRSCLQHVKPGIAVAWCAWPKGAVYGSVGHWMDNGSECSWELKVLGMMQAWYLRCTGLAP